MILQYKVKISHAYFTFKHFDEKLLFQSFNKFGGRGIGYLQSYNTFGVFYFDVVLNKAVERLCTWFVWSSQGGIFHPIK